MFAFTSKRLNIVQLINQPNNLFIMKSTKLSILLTGMFALSSLVSCNKTEDSATDSGLEQPNALAKQCSFVDNNWSSTAVLSTSFGSTTDTSFMNGQNSKIAALWGRSVPTLRFVKDATNPGSTYNAISYSTGKIYYGQAIYKDAKSKNSNNIVNAMILAHEFGHQLQFAFGLPSVKESTARPNELEADGFAGYYLRKPAGFNAGSFAAIASASDFAFAIGDNQTTSAGHHGTPPQRRSAVRLGFLLADPGNATLNGRSFDSNFFAYYTGVLNGTYRLSMNVVPEGMSVEGHNLMMLHMSELRSIANGTMSDSDFHDLQ